MLLPPGHQPADRSQKGISSGGIETISPSFCCSTAYIPIFRVGSCSLTPPPSVVLPPIGELSVHPTRISNIFIFFCGGEYFLCTLSTFGEEMVNSDPPRAEWLEIYFQPFTFILLVSWVVRSILTPPSEMVQEFIFRHFCLFFIPLGWLVSCNPPSVIPFMGIG